MTLSLFLLVQPAIAVSALPWFAVWLWSLLGILLVWAAIRGVRAAVRALAAIERQAKALSRQAAELRELSRLSADTSRAAAATAQALINSGRAWIVLEPSVSGRADTLTVNIRALNLGRSPAQIVSQSAAIRVLDSHEALPETAAYESPAEENSHPVPSRWVGPSAEFTAYTYYCGSLATENPQAFRDIREGKSRLILAGVVRYRDTLSETLHESRYCYWVFGTANGVSAFGPPAWNRLA